MPLSKDQTHSNVLISDLSTKGLGVARIDNVVVFIDHTYPGDRVTIRLTKKKKDHFESKLLSVDQLSEKRVKAFCRHFKDCGGCKIQDLDYTFQLEYKQSVVVQNFKRIGKLQNANILPILAAPKQVFYRNKLEFSFSDKKWISGEEFNKDTLFPKENALGFHVKGRFDQIIDIQQCHLQTEPANKIRNFIRSYALEHQISFSDLREHTGLLRSLFIRNTSTNEWMVNLVLRSDEQDIIRPLLNKLQEKFPLITSLFYTINPKVNDSLYELTPTLFSGKEYITEKLEHLKIQLGPKSFFQTNSTQALRLYEVVKDFAEINKKQIVYDLYSGVGSIGLFLADSAKKVIGIETVEESVAEAEKNKALNAIDNAEFHCGIVEKMLDKSFFDEHGKADIIILDPPRPGLHQDVIEVLLEVEAEKIVYVSCNPSTQARDLQLLSSKYEMIKSQPVDMFPHTLHVENVALLKMK